MSDWDNFVGLTRDALETLLWEGDAMTDRIEELEARLAQYRALYEAARYEVRDRETKLEELEELLMDVVADLRDGVSADKIDYRIGKVILRMDQ